MGLIRKVLDQLPGINTLYATDRNARELEMIIGGSGDIAVKNSVPTRATKPIRVAGGKRAENHTATRCVHGAKRWRAIPAVAVDAGGLLGLSV